jgi:hypothetical protein
MSKVKLRERRFMKLPVENKSSFGTSDDNGIRVVNFAM